MSGFITAAIVIAIGVALYLIFKPKAKAEVAAIESKVTGTVNSEVNKVKGQISSEIANAKETTKSVEDKVNSDINKVKSI